MTKKSMNAALAVAAIASATALASGAPGMPEPEMDAALSSGALFAMHVEWAEGFRRAAIDDAESLEPFFSVAAHSDWRGETRAELDATQLADFFNAAQVLVGAFDDEGAALAFWNPFWDALLFMRTDNGKLSLPGGRFSESVPPRVRRFAWASGESFRGEPPDAGLPRTATVVPGEAEPLSVSLWRVQKETIEKFDSLYKPETDGKVRLRTGTESPGSEADWKRIRARSALRLRMAPMLAANRVDFAVASRCTGLLRDGALWQLRDHFRDKAHDFFCVQLSEVPAQLRSEFEMYGYVPTPEGTLYYFVETGVPRLFATVTVPAGRLDRASGPEVTMEWYDLDKAGELLGAWENDRAAKKGGAQ
ncbi:MAG: hypothetical protein IJ783_09700 [Kiritimatiellae bacterium]|nr:hypothetical protein [Kiritimatiellia bacterium]